MFRLVVIYIPLIIQRKLRGLTIGKFQITFMPGKLSIYLGLAHWMKNAVIKITGVL